jgi:hypothetical protein
MQRLLRKWISKSEIFDETHAIVALQKVVLVFLEISDSGERISTLPPQRRL